jgi:hypothetical protein
MLFTDPVSREGGESPVISAPSSYLACVSPTPQAHPPQGTKAKRRWALLWGMGGTVLSALGFVALALFEQYNGMLSELRGDLKHFNETASEFVKKDTLERVREHAREATNEIHASHAARTQLEQELKASEKAREEMAHELRQMRERLAYLEGRLAGPSATASTESGK